MSETSKNDDKDRSLTLEEHIALRAHLDPLRKTVDEFCIAEGYSDMTTGRYPRIRLQKPEESETDEFYRLIDLWMTFDDCEGYRKTFTPDVPYDLIAGACLHFQSGELWVQYYKDYLIWKDRPFCEITPQNYMEAMKQAADEICRWDRAKVIREGKFSIYYTIDNPDFSTYCDQLAIFLETSKNNPVSYEYTRVPSPDSSVRVRFENTHSIGELVLWEDLTFRVAIGSTQVLDKSLPQSSDFEVDRKRISTKILFRDPDVERLILHFFPKRIHAW